MLAEELSSMGASANTFVCDVTDEAAVNDTISQVIDKMGDIYVLINNAGMCIRDRVIPCLPEQFRMPM